MKKERKKTPWSGCYYCRRCCYGCCLHCGVCGDPRLKLKMPEQNMPSQLQFFVSIDSQRHVESSQFNAYMQVQLSDVSHLPARAQCHYVSYIDRCIHCYIHFSVGRVIQFSRACTYISNIGKRKSNWIQHLKYHGAGRSYAVSITNRIL